MAVAEPAEPGSLGRVIVDEAGVFQRIVEARDATPAELAVQTINAGIYALPAPDVFDYLRRLKTDNAQGELYLTDAVTQGSADGHPVRLISLPDPDEALGVNDRTELARVHRLLIGRHLEALMKAGE